MSTIVIVDYGFGNLGSVSNMFRRVGVPAVITSSIEAIASAGKIVLPGVGSFDAGMRGIEDRGLREVLDRKALQEKVPVLGICLGAQLMTRGSEAGSSPGLGWIAAGVRRFQVQPHVKVPHMGWNLAKVCRASALTAGTAEESRYYFVHSYYIRVEDPAHSILKTTYGIEFDSGIQRENIYGVQFHLEKSHKFGMQLLANFARL